jgi:hypothetical protein
MTAKEAIRHYFKKALRWERGRQASGYDKMLLLLSSFPVPFDWYLLRFPEGSEIPPHVDPVQKGRHFRMNIILRHAVKGGEFQCPDPIWNLRRVKLFRPDLSLHSVTKVEKGSRLVFSIGWVRRDKKSMPAPNS